MISTQPLNFSGSSEMPGVPAENINLVSVNHRRMVAAGLAKLGQIVPRIFFEIKIFALVHCKVGFWFLIAAAESVEVAVMVHLRERGTFVYHPFETVYCIRYWLVNGECIDHFYF
jgi:hypothetical protein